MPSVQEKLNQIRTAVNSINEHMALSGFDGFRLNEVGCSQDTIHFEVFCLSVSTQIYPLDFYIPDYSPVSFISKIKEFIDSLFRIRISDFEQTSLQMLLTLLRAELLDLRKKSGCVNEINLGDIVMGLDEKTNSGSLHANDLKELIPLDEFQDKIDQCRLEIDSFDSKCDQDSLKIKEQLDLVAIS